MSTACSEAISIIRLPRSLGDLYEAARITPQGQRLGGNPHQARIAELQINFETEQLCQTKLGFRATYNETNAVRHHMVNVRINTHLKSVIFGHVLLSTFIKCRDQIRNVGLGTSVSDSLAAPRVPCIDFLIPS